VGEDDCLVKEIAAEGFGSRRHALHVFAFMIVHRRKTADGDRIDFREFLDPIFDPFFAIVVSFSDRERPGDTAPDAVVLAGQSRINQLSTIDGNKRSLAARLHGCVH
jgi:hypothetical protein